MGVKAIFVYRASADVDSVQRRLEEVLRARKVGRWALSCSLMVWTRPKEFPALPDSIATQMVGLKFSDAPGKAFMMAKDVILAADESFEHLQEKLKTFVPRATVAVQGTEYEMGDFSLRVGSVLLNNVSKNTVILELEYRPCEQANGCIALMNEFLGAHFGDLKEGQRLTAAPVDFADLPTAYSHRHASLQYVRLFTEMGLLLLDPRR